MKKLQKLTIFLLALILMLSAAMQVSASEYRFVYDESDVLTADEERLLEDYASEISTQYGCGIYIVTVRDYWEYGGSVRDAAENIFLDNGFGLGSEADGVMLLLSMAERDYALIAHGSLGNRAFTDYGKDLLSGEFLDDFRYDDWFDGFEDYIAVSADFLQAESEGTPVDRGGSGGSGGISGVFFLLIPAAVAGVSCGAMAASMKTARVKRNADDYILRKGIRITGRHDRFVNRTVVRQKIENQSSSGGTRVNSRGFSGKSGKF